MVTNLTNLTTITGIGDIIKFNNSVTNGIFTEMLIIVIFFMLLMIFLRNYSFEESILGSSFLCFVISIFFRILEWINFKFVLFFGIVTALAAMWVYISKK